MREADRKALGKLWEVLLMPRPTGVTNGHRKRLSVVQLQTYAGALIAAMDRFDREVGRFQQEVKRGIDEKCLDIRQQIRGVKQRVEKIQLAMSKETE